MRKSTLVRLTLAGAAFAVLAGLWPAGQASAAARAASADRKSVV